MNTMTISFKFKNKEYRFSRPYNNPKVDQHTTFDWIRECYKKVGAKPTQVTCRRLTHTNWSFWCEFII